MKNGLFKTLSIALIIAVLSGSFMVSIPVLAADLNWTTMAKPIVTVGTEANVYTIADGNTLYLFSNGDDKRLYKSKDAGITWSSAGLDAGSVLSSAGPIVKMMVSLTEKNILIATNRDNIYTTVDRIGEWITRLLSTPVKTLLQVLLFPVHRLEMLF
jgi:hypothetical protein